MSRARRAARTWNSATTSVLSVSRTATVAAGARGWPVTHSGTPTVSMPNWMLMMALSAVTARKVRSRSGEWPGTTVGRSGSSAAGRRSRVSARCGPAPATTGTPPTRAGGRERGADSDAAGDRETDADGGGADADDRGEEQRAHAEQDALGQGCGNGRPGQRPFDRVTGTQEGVSRAGDRRGHVGSCRRRVGVYANDVAYCFMVVRYELV